MMPVDTGTLLPAHNCYGRLCAEVYDLDKPIGSFGDLAFQLNHLSQLNGPVLEPACGSGRLLIPLLEAGIEVDGFDLSEAMLDQCRARAAERGLTPQLWRADFADFEAPRNYAAITVPVGSFLFAGGGAEAIAVLRRFTTRFDPAVCC
jgi:SAM-dependent methyltransferase